MRNIKKIKVITSFSIILVAGIFMIVGAKNISSGYGKNIVYSQINEQVKGVKQEKNTKVKKQKKENQEKKKIKPSKNENGAYNISGTIIVNKEYGLDKDYTYNDNQGLYDEATEAFEKMQKDAEKDRVWFHIVNRYRSYAVQSWMHEKYKKERENASMFSAQAGYSEHQTGLAFDLNGKNQETSSNEKFKDTQEYKWLKENAYKYGFILRYPEGKTDITGYIFEPWHYRYVGTDISYDLKDGDTTLEEYFNIK
ncbi:M15 family metallopeptidase [Intestinibacter sp.]